MRTVALPPLLVVEDDAHDMFLFTRLLKSAGAAHPLHIALNGEEAVELLDRVMHKKGLMDFPAAAFIDTKMSGMDGLEVLAWIRKRGALDRLPVVMLSHSDDPRDVARAHKLGAQCYLTKYPAHSTMTKVIEEIARFGRNGALPIFETPNNLLRARTRSPADRRGA